MPYQIIRFVLKQADGEREVGLVRNTPLVEGPSPEIGDIVRVTHYGRAFDAKVVWKFPSNDPDLARLRVEEI